MRKIPSTRTVFSLVALSFLLALVMSPAAAQRVSLNAFVGKWELTFVDSKDTRKLELRNNHGKLEGSYFTRQNESKELTDVVTNQDRLHFMVQGLSFNLRLKDGRLVGTVVTEDKKDHEVVAIKK